MAATAESEFSKVGSEHDPEPTAHLVPGQPASGSRPPTQIMGREEGHEHADGCCQIFLTILSWLLVVCFFPLSLFFTIKVVQEYERAIIFRLGRLAPGGAQGPGLFFILPCLDTFRCVDLRVVSFDVAPQEILTKDLVTVSVDAVVYYRVFEPTISVTNVENAGSSNPTAGRHHSAYRARSVHAVRRPGPARDHRPPDAEQPGRGYRRLGRQGRAGRGQGRASANGPAARHGGRGRGQPRGQGQGDRRRGRDEGLPPRSRRPPM